jgi:hypothetical protein
MKIKNSRSSIGLYLCRMAVLDDPETHINKRLNPEANLGRVIPTYPHDAAVSWHQGAAS